MKRRRREQRKKSHRIWNHVMIIRRARNEHNNTNYTPAKRKIITVISIMAAAAAAAHTVFGVFLLLFSFEGVVVAFVLLHGHFCSSFNSSVHFFIYSLSFFSLSLFLCFRVCLFIARYILCAHSFYQSVVRSVFIRHTWATQKKNAHDEECWVFD